MTFWATLYTRVTWQRWVKMTDEWWLFARNMFHHIVWLCVFSPFPCPVTLWWLRYRIGELAIGLHVSRSLGSGRQMPVLNGVCHFACVLSAAASARPSFQPGVELNEQATRPEARSDGAAAAAWSSQSVPRRRNYKVRIHFVSEVTDGDRPAATEAQATTGAAEGDAIWLLLMT